MSGYTRRPSFLSAMAARRRAEAAMAVGDLPAGEGLKTINLVEADGLAALELRTEQVVPAWDHDVLISAVTEVHEATGGGRPLVYFGSTFRGLA